MNRRNAELLSLTHRFSGVLGRGVRRKTAKAVLLLTPLQRGAWAWCKEKNRFSGFRRRVKFCGSVETAKAVQNIPACAATSLKRGANERAAEHQCASHSRLQPLEVRREFLVGAHHLLPRDHAIPIRRHPAQNGGQVAPHARGYGRVGALAF